MSTKNRLDNLEKIALPFVENETIWTWIDSETGEYRHDEPPEEVKAATEWISIEVKNVKD